MTKTVLRFYDIQNLGDFSFEIHSYEGYNTERTNKQKKTPKTHKHRQQ